ncbi:unnamed protein product, partial [Polarella glacialis]
MVRILPTLIIASVAGVALKQMMSSGEEVAFVQPQFRGAAAAMAAGLLAASVGAAPALANPPKFSFFGFGDGVNSDVYSQIDSTAYSPYSQYSTNPNYDPLLKEYVQKQKAQAEECFNLVKNTLPKYIKLKQAENIKTLLIGRTASMRGNMEYISGKENSALRAKARLFTQKIADMGVSAKAKQWKVATE